MKKKKEPKPIEKPKELDWIEDDDTNFHEDEYIDGLSYILEVNRRLGEE